MILENGKEVCEALTELVRREWPGAGLIEVQVGDQGLDVLARLANNQDSEGVLRQVMLVANVHAADKKLADAGPLWNNLYIAKQMDRDQQAADELRAQAMAVYIPFDKAWIEYLQHRVS